MLSSSYNVPPEYSLQLPSAPVYPEKTSVPSATDYVCPQPVAAFPVKTQTVKEESDEAGAAGATTRYQVEWYQPWSQNEQLNLIARLPDPDKNPHGFVKMLKQIQSTYKATGGDLEQLLKLGFEGQTRQMIYTLKSKIQDLSTAEAGEEIIKYVEKEWLKEKAGESWALATELRQEKDSAVSFWYKLRNALVEAGYREGEQRDKVQLMSSFLSGLNKEYREALLTARPEARNMEEKQIVSVCRGIDDRFRKEKEKDKDKKVQKVMMVTEGGYANRRYGTNADRRGQGYHGQQQGYQARRGPQCYACQKYGHIARNCNSKQVEGKAGKSSQCQENVKKIE